MAGKRIDQLSTLTSVDSSDLLVFYDVSDGTSEKTKSILYSDFESGLSASSNLISQLNSNVTVTDAGTGTITADADATEVLNMTATTQVLGVNGDSRVALNQTTDSVTMYAGATQTLALNDIAQTLGVSGDSRITTNQSVNNIQLYAGATNSLSVYSTYLDLGVDLNTNGNDIVSDAGQDISILPGAGGNILYGANTISGTGDIYCSDLHTASGTLYIGDMSLSSDNGKLIVDGDKTLYDSSGASELFYNGIKTFETKTTGIFVQPTSGSDCQLTMRDSSDTNLTSLRHTSGNLEIRNFDHGGYIFLRGEDATGSAKYLMKGDPDGASELYYAGNRVVYTTTDGLYLGGAFATPSIELESDNGRKAIFKVSDSGTYAAIGTTTSNNFQILMNSAEIVEVQSNGIQLQTSPSYIKASTGENKLALTSSSLDMYYNTSVRAKTTNYGITLYATSQPSLGFYDNTADEIKGWVYTDTSDNTVMSNVDAGGSVVRLISDQDSTNREVNWGATGWYPTTDNLHDLGGASNRWDDVRATNGTIQTSDERKKENITSSDLGLDFINDLNPVSYKFKDYDYTEEQEQAPTESGTITISGTHTFHRTHYGLVAQEVLTTLSGLGKTTEEFAGYIHDADDDTYGLRYTEFIAPIVKAIQELTARVEALEQA